MKPLALFFFVAAACTTPQTPEPSAKSTRVPADFDEYVKEFSAWFLRDNPERASQMGVHDHDALVRDLSAQGHQRRTAELKAWLARLNGIPRGNLEETDYFDHRILEYEIRAMLLELERVKGWKRDPRRYNGALNRAVSSILDVKFAPLPERMKAIESRLLKADEIYRAARENLEDVPALWAELGIKSARGTLNYLNRTLFVALRAQGHDSVPTDQRDSFEAARAKAAAATESYLGWLEAELQPRAKGDFRLGRTLFEEKLKYEEHFDSTCDELKAQNEEAIIYYKDWVKRVAEQIDPTRTPTEVMAQVTNEFPAPEKLIETAERYVVDAKQFVKDKNIIPLPTEDLPTIRPTPEYRRMTFASMNSPGVFETEAMDAYYNITNVDPTWDSERQKQHLTYFNYAGLLGISIHEAVPGHHTHGVFKRQSPSTVRKIFTPASLSEGWAHYVEQMMLDEGFGDGDPKIRLGQLRRALQRHARWYAGVEMHCFGATVEDAAKRYQEIAYFAEFPALRETQRGTYNPTYLYYALGRMEILRLREEQANTPGFSLSEFHRDLLAQGLPLPLYAEYLERH